MKPKITCYEVDSAGTMEGLIADCIAAGYDVANKSAHTAVLTARVSEPDLVVLVVLFVLGVFPALIYLGRLAFVRDQIIEIKVNRALSNDGGSAEIAQLTGLRDRGILTSDEFERARDRLLSPDALAAAPR